MAVYHVVPDGGDTPFDWRVRKVNVGEKSRHYTKPAAKRKAKEMASKGDSIVLHRPDGTVQRSVSP